MNTEQDWDWSTPSTESRQTHWPEPMSLADVEMAFYENFFFGRDLNPYPVQEEAFNRIFAGQHLMVMVPTGTGKTMMAKAGLMKALFTQQKAIYTTPLRALTEEKYREFCEDFGSSYVGFATGDYKINPTAPIQVVVAEILWNMIYGRHKQKPADVVVMDEGHYFNDHERGYVWEQSIIGLSPETQLIILSATVGNPQQFCQWSYVVRSVEMELVESLERRVPLYHLYEEKYLIEVVRELFEKGDYPAIIFSFGRQQCFEWARLLKSIRRFTSDEEQKLITEAADRVIVPRGLGEKLRSLLLHGIGIHHAGILPAYKQLIEELTLQRLIKFVVSTETISAGINLPAKRVIFPALRKHVQKKSRILLPAEYHQMAGRAGRPQFDTEGIAITLAPEQVVQEFRKEIRDAQKSRRNLDEEQIRRRAYSRARTEAQQNGDVSWDNEVHRQLVEGKPAALRSHTKITAEQILAIGLPDLTAETLPGVELVEAEIRAQQAIQEEKQRTLLEATAHLTSSPTTAVSNSVSTVTNASPTSMTHVLAASTPTEPEKNAGKSKTRGKSPANNALAKQLLALQLVGTSKPTSNQEEPSTTEPNPTESTASEPNTTEISETKPAPAIPATTEPDPTEPSVTERKQAEPERMEITITEPERVESVAPDTEQVPIPAAARNFEIEERNRRLLTQGDVLTRKLAVLSTTSVPSGSPLPPSLVSHAQSVQARLSDLNIRTVIDKLLLEDTEKREFHKQLVKITNNLKAFGILNEHGTQVRGWMIGQLRGIDGLFVYYCVMNHDLGAEALAELIEYLVDHDVIHNILNRKKDEKKREWIRERLRERRREGADIGWDDVETEYHQKFPRPLTDIEKIHQTFLGYVPHPELHTGKRPKEIWRLLEREQLSFMDFVEQHHLEEEEGNLFTYLSRVMKTAKMLFEVTGIHEFFKLEMRVRSRLAVIDARVIDDLWYTMKDPALAPPLKKATSQMKPSDNAEETTESDIIQDQNPSG